MGLPNHLILQALASHLAEQNVPQCRYMGKKFVYPFIAFYPPMADHGPRGHDIPFLGCVEHVLISGVPLTPDRTDYRHIRVDARGSKNWQAPAQMVYVCPNCGPQNSSMIELDEAQGCFFPFCRACERPAEQVMEFKIKVFDTQSPGSFNAIADYIKQLQGVYPRVQHPYTPLPHRR